MKDYYATIKIQQGRLRLAMNQAGIKTAAELSRRSGVSQSDIGDMLNFRRTPKNRSGEWRASTLSICKALCYEPDDLFPEHLHHQIITNSIQSFIEREQLSGRIEKQIGPYESTEASDMRRVVRSVMKRHLSKREMEVLLQRFWEGKTLDEAGAIWNLSRQRIRQIEQRAMRKLRFPKVARKLEPLCPFLDGCYDE